MPYIVILIIGVFMLVGCSDTQSDSNKTNTPSVSDLSTPPPLSSALQVIEPWSRQLAPGAQVAVGFMQINNLTDKNDTLVSVHSDSAERVEIHEMKHEDGIMKMRHLEQGLPLPMGQITSLESGGNHLMFINPKSPWQAGNVITVTLNFQYATPQTIEIQVRGL